MAYPLFLQKKIIGVPSVAAKLHAEWKSTVLAAPSPKYTMLIVPLSSSSPLLLSSSLSSLNLYAAPTAWVICVPSGLLTVW